MSPGDGIFRQWSRAGFPPLLRPGVPCGVCQDWRVWPSLGVPLVRDDRPSSVCGRLLWDAAADQARYGSSNGGLHPDGDPTHGAAHAPARDLRDARLDAARVLRCDVFQRSSAHVEGHKGYLALRNHALRGLDNSRKRAYLTVVHNFLLKRPEGTTAAERFFGQKPRSLFAAILESVEVPRLLSVHRDERQASPKGRGWPARGSRR